MTFCIQCALEAYAAGLIWLDINRRATFNETPEEHLRRAHPDPIATQKRRAELNLIVLREMGVDVNTLIAPDQ